MTLCVSKVLAESMNSRFHELDSSHPVKQVGTWLMIRKGKLCNVSKHPYSVKNGSNATAALQQAIDDCGDSHEGDTIHLSMQSIHVTYRVVRTHPISVIIPHYSPTQRGSGMLPHGLMVVSESAVLTMCRVQLRWCLGLGVLLVYTISSRVGILVALVHGAPYLQCMGYVVIKVRCCA